MNSSQRSTCSLLLTSLVLAASVVPGLTQIPWVTEPLSRNGMTEFYGIGQYLHSDDIRFNGPFGDVRTKMDDTGLGGFGFAYHFSDFFSVHADFMFGNATFSGNAPLESGVGTIGFKQDAFINTGRFNVDYNIINRRLTPFVTAGMGYQYLETDLNHSDVTTCWWDPWWGWVCSDHFYAWETDFTWNVGGGLRWNVVDGLMIKAMFGATWLEYSNSHGITTQLEGIFSIGWSF